MPSRGPALTFDPRYVTGAIDAWRSRELASIVPSALEQRTAELLREHFIALNDMGMREQAVAMSAVSRAVGVFNQLKLARRTTTGRGEARTALLTATALGQEVLSENPVSGTLYPRFAECLSKASTDLSFLLDQLADYGPISQPILQPLPGAPRRGTAYQVALQEGLSEYRQQTTVHSTKPGVLYEPANPKAAPSVRIKAAQTWALQAHPAGALKQLDKVISIGLAFGLLWSDVIQVSDVIAAKSIGLAATKTALGYHPNILNWPNNSAAVVPVLVDAITHRANGSGFATVQEVRGTIGRRLSLSPMAVDALLRAARDAGDRHEIAIELHFEPDEDQLYATQRDPLIWREGAFEFVAVLQGSHA